MMMTMTEFSDYRKDFAGEAKDRQLGAVQLMTIGQAKNRTDAILARGAMTADERTWLVRLSQFMLLSVF